MILALHAPDGFLSPGTALATAIISGLVLVFAMRQASVSLEDRLIPLAGIAAAFIFAAQMFNFPVAGGTTGHLLGAALAAVLLGPSAGAIVVTVVVVIQALAFADGGLTALGYNVLNMAIVPAFGGYAVFRLARRLMPSSGGGIVVATGLAAWASVVMSSMAFSIEWLFGATAPVAFDDVFAAMVGVHSLIGIGEGFISALALGAVVAARPDLVFGARGLTTDQLLDRRRPTLRSLVLGGAMVAFVFATLVSQFAADSPDGLEAVASSQGFADTAGEHALGGSILASYATEGIDDEAVSLAVAGTVGTLVTFGVAAGVLSARRSDRHGSRAV